MLWIDCNAEDGLEQITALFVGSATASRVNLFDMADFSYAGRIDKGDGNFMTSIAEARTLPEPLSQSAAKLRAAWPA